jgi:CP family cyanate transporter-like MFS transporter
VTYALIRFSVVVDESSRLGEASSVPEDLPMRHAGSLGGTIGQVRSVKARIAPRHGGSATRSTAAILSVVVLVALNLRLALSSLPVVATTIQEETGWSDAFIGILTTIPVLGMGVCALGVPRLAERIGRRAAVSAALATMAIALTLRAFGAVALTMLISAVLAGVAIAVIGGLVPGIVREQLAGSMGTATALWTAALMGGAALGAAATFPIAEILGGWNLALAFWALPAVAGLIAWITLERGSPAHDRPAVSVRLRDLPWRSPVAWSLTGLMALNSIIFYSLLAWIAPSYEERGYSAETAGLFFAIFTGSQILAALTLPRISHRTAYRRTVFTVTIVVCVVTLTLIALAPNVAPPVVLVVLAFNLSGGFAMALGLLSEYAVDAAASARLTAMTFSITYIVAACGPFIAGALMDAVDSWALVFGLLAVVALAQLATVPRLTRGIRVD